MAVRPPAGSPRTPRRARATADDDGTVTAAQTTEPAAPGAPDAAAPDAAAPDAAAPDAAAPDAAAAVDTAPYDAVLLLSFGGPEQPADVMPFLRRVTGGRGIPEERLAEVAEHYHHFGGRSPINDQNRAFLAAIRADLADHGVDVPVYWGNRNWDPLLADTLRAMRADGVRRAAVFATSAYSSYSGCRQYREDLAAATADVAADPGPHANPVPVLDKLRHYHNHPGFVEPTVDRVLDALQQLPAEVREGAALAFTTHSIPTTMDAGSGPDGQAYSGQHAALARLVTDRVHAATGREHRSDLVFCSRSGPPSQPWLEPDVNDHLRELAAAGVPAVVAVPFGFVSDHMEVVYDLDTEAAQTAAELGLPFVRAATVGTDPRFVAVVRELLVERAATDRARAGEGTAPARPAEGPWPPSWDICAAGCCPNPRGPKPALCGLDPAA